MLPKSKRGIVTQLRAERNWGYVSPEDEDGREVWFHASACPAFSSLQPGSLVTFIERNTPKGPRAIAVHLLTQEADK